MARPITLASGQWADLGLENLCKLLGEMGFDGVELMANDNLIDLQKAAASKEYCERVHDVLDKNNLKCWAFNVSLIGQCVGDVWDKRLDNFAPAQYAGKPEEIRKWAIDFMMQVPEAANNFGVDLVLGFLGSPIWKMWYSFPQTTDEMVEEGFDQIVELWTPILDEFQKKGVKYCLEVHPTEIAFDYYSTQKLFEKLNYHPAFGLNFDPSHLVWQGVDPKLFLQDFSKYVYHVHMKDAAVTLDGKTGILGSHIAFGSEKRGWNFRSLGHGNVNFEDIIRVLNETGYSGPLSIEWEDNGMERMFGLREAFEYVKRLNFDVSNVDFDSALKNE